MTMSVSEAVAAWQKKLAHVSSNLLELRNCHEVQSIRTALEQGQLLGVSGTRGERALSQLDDLWNIYEALCQEIETAAAFLARNSFFRRYDNEAYNCLTTATIPVHSSQDDITTRELGATSTSSGYITPNAAMALMEDQFKMARADLLAIYRLLPDNAIHRATDPIGARLMAERISSAASKNLEVCQ